MRSPHKDSSTEAEEEPKRFTVDFAIFILYSRRGVLVQRCQFPSKHSVAHNVSGGLGPEALMLFLQEHIPSVRASFSPPAFAHRNSTAFMPGLQQSLQSKVSILHHVTRSVGLGRESR
jgi:hypothetical protein